MIILPKLTDKEKKKIIADYVDNGNYRATGRKNNISEATVRNIIKNADNKEITQKFAQKKEENTETTLQYMDKQHDTKIRIIGKLLKAIEEKSDNIDMFTSVKDLATAYGILIDKELKYIELKNQKDKNDENQEAINNATDILIKIRKTVDDRYERE